MLLCTRSAIMSFASYFDDDSSSGTTSQSDNSTCSLVSTCTQCIEQAAGCLWCSVPKESAGFGRGACYNQHGEAQERCEITELQVREREESM